MSSELVSNFHRSMFMSMSLPHFTIVFIIHAFLQSSCTHYSDPAQLISCSIDIRYNNGVIFNMFHYNFHQK